MKNYKGMETAFIHGGIYGDKTTGAVNTPIYQTSTYEQDGIGENKGWEYSRTGNPTRSALESLIAELEGGKFGYAFSSGMAAITSTLSLFKTGDKVLISSNVYGGTFRVLDKIFVNFGIKYEIVNTSDVNILRESITKEVKAILIESPANPLLGITDIAAVSKISKEYDILLIVDNTFMTPFLQNPLKLGADIVIHSATKFLGGHSDLVAGLVVVNDDNIAKKIAFIQNSTGAILGPFDSFLLIRGIKTLGVRMERHIKNANTIALFLKNHRGVKKVYYPGLKDFIGYEVNKLQARGPGAMISFDLHENYNVKKFFKSLKLIALAESLGGVESLTCHPASMTHEAIPKDIREKLGIHYNLVRVSVGIEDVEDLIADLNNALLISEV